MKKLIILFVNIILYSCLTENKNKEELCICKDVNMQYIHSKVHEINELRLSIPCNESPNFQNHINKIEIAFEKFVENKNKILPLLLCFQDDERFSLYHKVPFSSNHLGHATIPNYIHSLYLFEAIIRNDIFFNRRGTNIYIRWATAVDYINTIIDTAAPPSYFDSIQSPFAPNKQGKYGPLYFSVDFSKHKSLYDDIWELYFAWLKTNYYNETYETYPLDGTKYRWGTFYEDGLKIKKKNQTI